MRTVASFALLLTLALGAAEQSADARLQLDDGTFTELAAHAQRAVTDWLKALPDGHRLLARTVRRWSEKTQSQALVLVSLTAIDSQGRADGELRFYHPNGFVTQVIPYQAGVKQGLEQKFTVHGNERILIAETPWQQDRIVGVKNQYYPSNGKLRTAVPHVDGEPEGEATQYDLPGRVVRKTHYRQGKREGEMIDFWPDSGKPKRIVPCRAGRTNGVVREFFDNGQLRREITVVDEKFDGLERLFNEDGELVRTRYWINDEEVGKEVYEQQQK